jgi:hypothetical protein
MDKSMIDVSIQFRPHIKVEYPVGNKKIFEEWFFANRTESPPFDRHYLPIFWTSYFVNHNYANDKRKVMELQDYVNSLDRSKKYFTILQYDSGPIVDFKDLDIKVFGSGGGRIDSPIALLTAPHPFQFKPEKKHFCSFAGSNTHPIREQLVKNYHSKYLFAKPTLSIKDYCQLMAHSIFALAPRGFGLTSFRICEALQFGSIPVYLSDEHIIPYGLDFNEYGVLVHSSDIDRLDDILKGFTQAEIQAKQEAGRRIYNELYTFEGARNWILENI